MAVQAAWSEGPYRFHSPEEERRKNVNAYLERYMLRAREPFTLAIGDSVSFRSLTPQEERWLQGRANLIRHAAKDPKVTRNDEILRGFLQEEVAHDALNLIAATTGLPLRVRPSIFMEQSSPTNAGADFVIVLENSERIGKILGGINIKSKRPSDIKGEDASDVPHTNSILGEAYPVMMLRLGGIPVADRQGHVREMRSHIREVMIPRFLHGHMDGILPGIPSAYQATFLAAIQERFSEECYVEQQALLEGVSGTMTEEIKDLLSAFMRMDVLLGAEKRTRRERPA